MKLTPLIVACSVAIGFVSVADADQPKAAVLDAYRQFLGNLPKDQPASISKAIEQYEKEIIDHGPATRDHAFLIFLDFHREVCTAIEAKHSDVFTGTRQEPYYYWQELLKSETYKEIQLCGLELEDDHEGGAWIRGIPGHIPRIMEPYLTHSLGQFLRIRKKELEESYSCDAALIISFERLAERLGQWEDYLRKYPDSLVKADATALRDEYLRMLICGCSNTQPEVYEGGEDIKGIYQRFVERFPDTKSGKVVAAFAKKYEEHGWRFSQVYEYGCSLVSAEIVAPQDIWPAIQLDYRVRDYQNKPFDR